MEIYDFLPLKYKFIYTLAGNFKRQLILVSSVKNVDRNKLYMAIEIVEICGIHLKILFHLLAHYLVRELMILIIKTVYILS